MNIAPLSTGTLVFLGIAIGVAVLSHWRIRRFWLASLVSAVATFVIFLVASTIQAGLRLPDSLGVVSFLFLAGSAFLIAAIVGFVVASIRRLILTRASRLNAPSVGV
jgi:hypothetical protein